jgi:hypothetical protein
LITGGLQGRNQRKDHERKTEDERRALLIFLAYMIKDYFAYVGQSGQVERFDAWLKSTKEGRQPPEEWPFDGAQTRRRINLLPPRQITETSSTFSTMKT